MTVGHSITVQIPATLIEIIDPSGHQADARVAEALAVLLFHAGEVSSRWAAKEVGISWEDFLAVLHRYNVPYVDLTPEELESDIENARRASAESHR